MSVSKNRHKLKPTLAQKIERRCRLADVLLTQAQIGMSVHPSSNEGYRYCHKMQCSRCEACARINCLHVQITLIKQLQDRIADQRGDAYSCRKRAERKDRSKNAFHSSTESRHLSRILTLGLGRVPQIACSAGVGHGQVAAAQGHLSGAWFSCCRLFRGSLLQATQHTSNAHINLDARRKIAGVFPKQQCHTSKSSSLSGSCLEKLGFGNVSTEQVILHLSN